MMGHTFLTIGLTFLMFLFLDHIFSTFGLTFVTISFLSAINFSNFFFGGGVFYPLFMSVLKRFLYMCGGGGGYFTHFLSLF